METFLNGQSIGKRIMKIKVVNIQGNQASLSQYFLRLLFRAHLIVPLVAYVIASIFFYDNDQFNNFYIAILCVALLLGVGTLIFMLANSYNQRLGDYVANTLVIEATATANIHQTIFQDIDETEYKVRYPQVMQLTDRDMNGIRNILETGTKNKENIAYMQRIKERILNVLEITSDEEPYQFLTQLLRDYNYLTSK
jgi:hypothetical protein